VSAAADGLFDLTGRTALVTGAKRGIGRAMAEALASAGADVIGVSKSLETSGSEVGKAVESYGRKFTAYQVDFADRAAVASLAREVEPRAVDILVNNAGTILRAPAAEHADELWDEVIDVDLSSQFVLTRELGRGMLARGSGKVIFTASLLSFQGGINVVSYAAAKSGIAGVIRALANEWTRHGVTVNGIAPGYIATDNTRALREDTERFTAILDRTPAGRWGDPADLAGATIFLASRAADYVSGVILPVDGGWLGR
jgi:2-dehydro-3-deoxy-D-gluconate 5-dehydrogenase